MRRLRYPSAVSASARSPWLASEHRSDARYLPSDQLEQPMADLADVSYQLLPLQTVAVLMETALAERCSLLHGVVQ